MGSVAESVAAKIQSIFELCKLLRFFRERLRDNPTHSENTFFQPPCALALLLCAWRLFRALGCGGVGEVGYTWVGVRYGAVASALLRQSRDTAEALSEMFLVVPCALSEGRAHSLGLLQYSQHCHRSLIQTRCGWLLLRFYHWQ